MVALESLPAGARSAIVRGSDLLLATAAWPLAFWVRGDLDPAAVRVEALELLTVAAAAALVFAAVGVHRALWRHAALADLFRVGAGAALLAAAVTLLAFWRDRGIELPRAVPLVYALLVFSALSAVRVVWMVHTRRRVRVQLFTDALELRPLLLVGAGEETALAIRLMRQFAPAAVPVGILDGETPPGRALEGVPVIGRLDELKAVIARLTVRGLRPARILVTGRRSLDAEDLRRLEQVAREERIPLDRFEQLLRLEGYAAPPRPARAADVRERAAAIAEKRLYFALKRALDASLAALGLLFFAPLLGLSMLLVRLWLGPPVFFRQLRRGRDLVPFELLKLKTMADPITADGQRLREEERHHPVGRLLRRLRIDELPQLWNVLKGDMALVGPRPLIDRELLELPDRGRARACVPPGLTGWAQVNGGQLLSLREKEALDLWYIRHASLALDLKILWLTLVMIVRGERVNGVEVERALKARAAGAELEAAA